MQRPIPQAQINDTDFEIAVVGAGISGIGAAIECKRHGFESFVLLEARSRLGGTWLTNTYPGIAVDISSSSYCYPFETQYPWSRAFAPGHEILSYIEHCSEKYKIDAHVRYDSKVIGAVFDGKSYILSARFAGSRVARLERLGEFLELLDLPTSIYSDLAANVLPNPP